MKKVMFFHNVIFPLLMFLVCFSQLFAFGFSIKGLINFSLMVYSVVVMISFDEAHKEGEKK